MKKKIFLSLGLAFGLVVSSFSVSAAQVFGNCSSITNTSGVSLLNVWMAKSNVIFNDGSSGLGDGSLCVIVQLTESDLAQITSTISYVKEHNLPLSISTNASSELQMVFGPNYH